MAQDSIHPKLGSFLSADTIVPGAGNPQAYNRYSYVMGNPLKYVDPSGHGQYQTKADCEGMGATPMGGNKPPRIPALYTTCGDGGTPDDDPNPQCMDVLFRVVFS
jgi:hypothetical protein